MYYVPKEINKYMNNMYAHPEVPLYLIKDKIP